LLIMKKMWIVLALILIIAGQLIVLSSFHDVDSSGVTETNMVITVAKLNYVDARVTITVHAKPPVGNGTTNVEIVCPDGTTVNLTSTNWEAPQTYTKTYSFPRTGDNFGSSADHFSTGNQSITVSQENPLVIAINSDVGDPQSYRLSYSDQVMQFSSFIIFGAAAVSVSGYGVAL
jgi:hypothetical protein